MASPNSRPAALAIGVDVGGTWIRVRALAARRIARAAGRVAHVSDLEGFLRDVWRRHRWRRADVGALVVSSKGIWTERECQRMAHRLSGLAHRVRVIPDAQAAALGALAGRPGILVLAGTGSIVVGHDGQGRWARAGGFGALLGDEGSGFWLGREWLRATTGPGEFERIRALAHAPKPVAAIAKLAPAVIARARAGNRRARRIARAGQLHLAAGAIDVARRLALPSPVAMSWAGGVMSDPWFRAGVARAVARGGLASCWAPPVTEPVVAAAHLAESLAGPQHLAESLARPQSSATPSRRARAERR